MGIFNFFQSRNSLKREVTKIKKDIEAIMIAACNEKISVIQYGAYEINPKYLVYWIRLDTDKLKISCQMIRF